MRKFILAATALVGVGLLLFFLVRAPAPDEDESSASRQATGSKARAGMVAQRESPEDVGVRGTADAGSTPALAQAPSEEDGVLEVEVLAGQRPVSGASLRLYWRGPRDPNLGEVSWRLASRGTTDEQGHARLASRPGSYLVAVRAEGHALLLKDVVRPYGEARTFLRLTLEPGQALSGRTVEQGSQEPLPLVELVLTPHGRKLDLWQAAEAPAEERIYASSDERGSFRVEGLAPGNYELEARAPGHARKVLRSVRVPAAGPLTVELQAASVIEGFVVDARGNPAAGAEVHVSGHVPEVTTTGPGGGFSIEVEAGAHTVSARRGSEAGSLEQAVTVSAGKTVRDVRIQLGQGAVLEGRVVASASGEPIEGANVDVSPYGHSGDSGRAVTDGEGQFSVGGLAPGSYDLVVAAPGFSTLSRRALTVSSGERFSIDVQLTGSGTVEGQVRDAAGQPIQDAQVVSGSRWGGGFSEAPVESRTDATGHYRLQGVPAGSITVTARRPGATLGTTQRVDVSEGGSAQLDFILEETGTVDGVVRAARGALPAGPLVVTANPLGSRGFSPSDFRSVDVDAAGSFRMELPPGNYQLRAMLEGGEWVSQEPKRVEVEAGKAVHVELSWQGKEDGADSLRGVVLEPDGTPSPEAFVTVTAEASDRPRGMDSTDAQGRFTISSPSGGRVSDDRLKLVARNGGRVGEVEGVRPGEREIVVKLRPAASVRGRVVRASGGAPIKGFTLSLLSQEGLLSVLGNGKWEFPGDRFEIRDVPAEPVKVLVRTADGAGGDVQVTPGPGAVSEVEITVKGLARVRGRVVDAATQEPLADAMAFIQGGAPLDMDKATGMDGRFVLEGVPPGEHTLLVVRGRSVDRRAVTVVEGEVIDVGDILLSAPRVFPGTIGARATQDGDLVLFSDVTPEGPAARAGLEEGDVLVAVDGAPVTKAFEAYAKLRGEPGSTVTLTVRRAGGERSISVTRAR